MLEFDGIGPVPLAGMMLADMGADVVRIERPKSGNEPWADVGGAVLNRSRPVLQLDLKACRDEAFALIERADALVEGFRPGVMERLGLGPEVCLQTNPKLVYGRVTGWGQDGPLSRQAGHDLNYLGLTGALYAMGPADRPPPVPLNLLADYAGGTMFLVTGILAALHAVHTTGRGTVVDAAMVDGIAVLTSLFHAFRATGAWSDNREDNLLDGAAPFYRCYTCADGRFVAVAALEPKFFAELLTGLGVSPGEVQQHARETWPLLQERFASIFASEPRDYWAEKFRDTDACVSPVLAWNEVPDNEHFLERATFQHRAGVTHPSPAPRFDGAPGAVTESTVTTYADILESWSRARDPIA